MTTLAANRSAVTYEAYYRSRLLAQVRRLSGDAFIAWNAAFAKLRRQADAAELLAAVEANDVAALERLFGLSRLGEFLANPKLLGKPMAFEEIARRAVFSVADHAAERLTAQLGVPIEAKYMQGRATAWLRQHGAEFIKGVTTEAAGAIRVTLAEGASAGMSPSRIVEALRENLPLTEKWAGAVTKYEGELLAAGTSRSDAKRYAQIYAERLRTRRAQNIVQTELHNAARQAEADLIEESTAQGLIDSEIYEREWVAILSGNICRACHGAHGLRAPIGGTFPNGMRYAAMHPVNDRCGESLRRKNEPAPSTPAFVEPKPGGTLRPITPSEAAG